MEMLAMILFFGGMLVSVVSGIWFLIIAFSESILWGLGCMFIPFVGLIFLCLNFSDTWKPFVVNLVGVAMAFAGFMIGAGSVSP